MADEPTLPTAHEIARRLLAGPDLPVIHQNDCVRFRIAAVRLNAAASWYEGAAGWMDDLPAVELSDEPD